MGGGCLERLKEGVRFTADKLSTVVNSMALVVGTKLRYSGRVESTLNH